MALPKKMTMTLILTKKTFEILEQSLGYTRETWNVIIKDFKSKCARPDIWETDATDEK